LVDITNFKVRLSFTLRGGQLRVLPPNGTRIDLDLGVVLPDHRKKFIGSALERRSDQVFRNDVGRSLVPAEQPFEMSLRLPHPLMVHRDLFHDLRPVHLRLQDILLHPLADLIVGRGILNELVKNRLVLPQDAKRLLQIGQLEIVGFHRIGNAGLRNFDFSLLRAGVAFGDVPTRPQLSWIGQFL
jgi:hypothetical protein